MRSIESIMTRQVQAVSPDTSLQDTAAAMARLDVGAMPVCEGGWVIGIVTDRDITVRGVAEGLPGTAPVRSVMSGDPLCCRETDSLADVEEAMGEAQIRRVPILDREGRLAGIVSLGDLATRQPGDLDAVVRDISAPTRAG